MRSCANPERVDHLKAGDSKKAALGHLQPVLDGSTDENAAGIYTAGTLQVKLQALMSKQPKNSSAC